MTDVSNIDHSKITDLVNKTDGLTKESHKGLSKPFIDSIPEMFLSGQKMNSSVGEQITSVQKQALSSINTLFNSILEHERGVQKKQSDEKPSDFKSDPIPDLRNMVATGFPREDTNFFKEIIPKIKI